MTAKAFSGFLCAAMVLVGIAGVSGVAPAFSQSESDILLPNPYPYLSVAPRAPVPGDSVAVSLIYGTASNSCMAPTYTGITHTIRLVAGAMPPALAQYGVYCEFTEIPLPPGQICPMIYAPVDYGPSYNLGLLPAGHYLVYGNDTLVGSFEVRERERHTVRGTVYENVGPLDMIKTIPGAVVYLQASLDWIQTEPSLTAFRYWPYYQIIDSAIADRSGNYSFTNVVSDYYQLVFTNGDHQSKTLPLPLSADTVVNVWLLPLNATGGVAGTITEACLPGTACLWNPPVPGCTVEVYAAMYICAQLDLAGAAKATAVSAGELRAVTDSLGRFRIDGISIYEDQFCAGHSYSLKVTKAGYRDTFVSFEPQYMFTVRVDIELTPLSLAVTRTPNARQSTSLISSVNASSVVLNLDSPKQVKASLLSLDGRRVEGGSVSAFMGEGSQRLALAKGVAPGAYLLEISAGGVRETRVVRVDR